VIRKRKQQAGLTAPSKTASTRLRWGSNDAEACRRRLVRGVVP